ncbi:MAG: hypothetical protein ACREDA_05915 [Methylocella sp.]
MIDNLDQTGRLLAKLEESLPLAALATPVLAASIREQSGGAEISPHCRVTRVHYLGDEGGILCHLAFDADIGPRAFIVSITHLLFDRRHPLAREIASYQKHRVKRLRPGPSIRDDARMTFRTARGSGQTWPHL